MTAVKTKLIYSVGLLLRSHFRKTIRKWCFELNLKLNLEELKGWTGSEFLIEVEGNYENRQKLKQMLKHVEDKMEEDRK